MSSNRNPGSNKETVVSVSMGLSKTPTEFNQSADAVVKTMQEICDDMEKQFKSFYNKFSLKMEDQLALRESIKAEVTSNLKGTAVLNEQGKIVFDNPKKYEESLQRLVENTGKSLEANNESKLERKAQSAFGQARSNVSNVRNDATANVTQQDTAPKLGRK